MSDVTLADIKATQASLAAMIATLEARASSTLAFHAASITLAPGERYAGLMLDVTGAPSHHLVLMSARGEGLTWDAALAFASKAGGDLPTRREQSLLFANLREHFESEWYWSGEKNEKDGSSAWLQVFRYGYQYVTRKSYEGRAVAVRRFPA